MPKFSDKPASYAQSAEARQVSELACLQYFHENRCPWSEAEAAENVRASHLASQRYLRQFGSPWSALKYLGENICYSNEADVDMTPRKHHLRYLNESDQHERRPQRVQRQAQARRKQHRARRLRKRLAAHRQRQQAWP
jgi:hypothetical protein